MSDMIFDPLTGQKIEAKPQSLPQSVQPTTTKFAPLLKEELEYQDKKEAMTDFKSLISGMSYEEVKKLRLKITDEIKACMKSGDRESLKKAQGKYNLCTIELRGKTFTPISQPTSIQPPTFTPLPQPSLVPSQPPSFYQQSLIVPQQPSTVPLQPSAPLYQTTPYPTQPTVSQPYSIFSPQSAPFTTQPVTLPISQEPIPLSQTYPASQQPLMPYSDPISNPFSLYPDSLQPSSLNYSNYGTGFPAPVNPFILNQPLYPTTTPFTNFNTNQPETFNFE